MHYIGIAPLWLDKFTFANKLSDSATIAKLSLIVCIIYKITVQAGIK